MLLKTLLTARLLRDLRRQIQIAVSTPKLRGRELHGDRNLHARISFASSSELLARNYQLSPGDELRTEITRNDKELPNAEATTAGLTQPSQSAIFPAPDWKVASAPLL